MDGSNNTDRFAERQYPPSPFRIEEAARRGRTPRSADLVSALAGLAGLLMLAWVGEGLVGQLTAAFGRLLDARVSPLAPAASTGDVAWAATWPVAGTAGLLALAVLCVAAGTGLLQGGWRIVMGNVRPDWQRLSVGAGMGRLFSRRAWVRLAAAAMKMAAVAVLAVLAVRESLAEIRHSTAQDAGGILGLAGGLAWGLGLRAMAAIIVLAGADYLYQRWEHRRDLRMTRREFLEDLKRSEGDPLARSRRKRKAAARSAGLPARLAHASVVVASPEGRVVALQCFLGMKASRVVARADRRAGARLLEAAADLHIPVLADPELAEVLFARCTAGTVAPRTAHRAVEEFLTSRGARHQGMAALEKS